MKQVTILSFLLSILVVSCSKDDNNNTNQANNFQNFNSQICNTVTGPTALYWDYAHGLPVPLTQIPTISNPGAQFIHSQYPGLGFTMPQGYTATEVLIQQTATLGVNVVRDDNNVVWRYVPTSTFQGNVDVNDILAFEINTMFSILGFNGTPRCSVPQRKQGPLAVVFRILLGRDSFGSEILRL